MPLLVRDPSTRELLRSPVFSAAVLATVALLCGAYAYSCTQWVCADVFAALPVRLAGWAVLAWVAVVGVGGVVAVVRERHHERDAYLVARGALVLVVLPTALLWLVRFTA